MGYKLAGYNVLGGVELDKSFAELYKKNLYPNYFFNEDIRDFNRRENLPAELYNIDVLDGSPPCSSFSVAGHREKDWGKEKRFEEGQKLQRLDDLVFEYCNAAARLNPKIVVMENVPGLIKGKAKYYAAEIIRKLQNAGYKMQLFRLNAALMGVPQVRERLFFIGNRISCKPLKLHFNQSVLRFGEVRSEHGRPIKEGSKTKFCLDCATDSDRCFSDIFKRLTGQGNMFSLKIYDDKKVAPTLMTGCAMYRLCDRTALSDSDAVAVQTFPQDYNFGKRKAAGIVGYTVPPVMMANLAHQIKIQWLN